MALSRRDLFDARFQLISTDDGGRTDEAPSEVDFVDAPSDLVPGVYEGGLKTWECSLDLVHCLDSIYGAVISSTMHGKRILEVFRPLTLQPRNDHTDNVMRSLSVRVWDGSTITVPHPRFVLCGTEGRCGRSDPLAGL